MRIALAIPLLLLGACQVSKDDNNGTTSVTYNSDVAENAAADVGNTAAEHRRRHRQRRQGDRRQDREQGRQQRTST